ATSTLSYITFSSVSFSYLLFFLSLLLFFFFFFFFFFNDTATTEIYTLSLHDALPIWSLTAINSWDRRTNDWYRSTSCCTFSRSRSEEHTSELQSPCNLVCRLLLEKKKKKKKTQQTKKKKSQ